MRNLLMLGVVLVGLGAGALLATAQETTPTAEVGTGHGMVGAWHVTITIGGQTIPALTTFMSDGTMFTSSRPVQPAPPVLPADILVQSLGHGAWVATGEDTVDVTFVFLQTDPVGNDLGTRTIAGSLTLDPGGDTWSGPFTATIADPSGSVLSTADGTVSATRIEAGAPATE